MNYHVVFCLFFLIILKKKLQNYVNYSSKVQKLSISTIDLQKPLAFLLMMATLFCEENNGMEWNAKTKNIAPKNNNKKKKNKRKQAFITLSPRHSSTFQLSLQQAYQVNRRQLAFNLNSLTNQHYTELA